MMAARPNLLVALFIISSLIYGNAHSMSYQDNNVYIVYMGAKPHDDHHLIVQSHYDVLTNVLGSEEEAKKAMVHNYKYSFSGFSAALTKSQAKKIAEIPGVIKVMQDTHTSVPLNTRSWDYMDLSVHSPNNLLHKSNMGDGIIIGVIDSGIHPSKVFNDENHGPIPSKWKGICKSEGTFNATEMCNKKLIGARWFREGISEKTKNATYLVEASALDDFSGHGSHVASTAAGSFVDNVRYFDMNVGTFRGGAPRAKLAIYKVCWFISETINGKDTKMHVCSNSDILAAFDQAVEDGVDIISVSLGDTSPGPATSDIDSGNGETIGSFHAVAKGIPVVFAAGNAGPTAMTVGHLAPWEITVAATTIDRSFNVLITLDNNITIVGEGIFAGKEIGFTKYDCVVGTQIRTKEEMTEYINDKADIKGKVVVAFVEKGELGPTLVNLTEAYGGVAVIMVAPQQDNLFASKKWKVPLIRISQADGNILIDSLEKYPNRTMLKMSTTRIHLGKPIQTKVGWFSSRGPNAKVLSILKPDISAPGANILGAASGDQFTLMTGTSMAAPHVTGVIALLKKAHPDWSPAALKSAISTTAWNSDSHGSPIYAEGSSLQLANPFDYGGGVINPNAANEPGLVYDMGTTDYVHYLCALGYKNEGIYNMTRFGEIDADNGFTVSNICSHSKLSIYNVNVPSITIEDLRKSITLVRTVTNVGPVNSKYEAIIQAPFGTNITVTPKVLNFDSKETKISFQVTISSILESLFFNFGSLTWTDGKHYVRIPISVKSNLSP